MNLSTQTKKLLYLGPEGTYSHIAACEIIKKYNLQKDEFKKQLYTDKYEKSSDAEKEAIDVQVANVFSQLNHELP